MKMIKISIILFAKKEKTRTMRICVMQEMFLIIMIRPIFSLGFRQIKYVPVKVKMCYSPLILNPITVNGYRVETKDRDIIVKKKN